MVWRFEEGYLVFDALLLLIPVVVAKTVFRQLSFAVMINHLSLSLEVSRLILLALNASVCSYLLSLLK